MTTNKKRRQSPYLAPGEGTEDEVARSNMGLVHWVARNLLKRGTFHLNLEEAVSAGTVGLLKAMRQYRPKLGSFSTYAAAAVRNAIKGEALKTWREWDRMDGIGCGGGRTGREMLRLDDRQDRSRRSIPKDAFLPPELTISQPDLIVACDASRIMVCLRQAARPGSLCDQILVEQFQDGIASYGPHTGWINRGRGGDAAVSRQVRISREAVRQRRNDLLDRAKRIFLGLPQRTLRLRSVEKKRGYIVLQAPSSSGMARS